MASATGKFRVTIGVKPDPRLVGALIGRETADRLSDFRPAFRSMYPAIAASLRDNMRSPQQLVSKSGPYGGKWDPLKAAYLARKIKSGGGRAPLIATGGTMAAVGNRLSLGKRSMTLGLRGAQFKHAPALNFGSAHNNQGARPFMGLNRSAVGVAEAAMLAHINEILNSVADKLATLPPVVR